MRLISRLLAALTIVTLLNACAKPVLEVALDSTLTILEPDWDYSYDQMRDKWVVTGNINGNAPRLHIENKEYFLAIAPNRAPFAALRPIKAQLLATPFLSWTWRIAQDTQPNSTLQLAIGLRDEKITNDAWNLSRFWSNSLPPFSRSLIIEWGRSAHQTGSLWVSKKDRQGRSRARYVARGGLENQGLWWREHIDLSSLHSTAWPGLDMRYTQIVFVGFILNKHDSTLASHLKKISLSR